MKKKLVVIGGGPGGYVAAIRAAQLGAEVTVVEKSKVGGTCLNLGCIPTKALLASAEVCHVIKNAAQYGIEISGEVKVDFQKIMERKNGIVANLNKGIKFLFDKNGVNLINGFGDLIDPHTVLVKKDDGSEEKLTADYVIIATGSVPVRIPIFPFDGKRVITSDEALNLPEQPKRMIIVGGGVIGVEFATFYSRLGTEVTIAEMMPHCLPPEDEDTAKLLARSLKKDKIKLMTSIKIEETTIEGDVVKAKLGDGTVLEADVMLVATGRAPNISALNLEGLGIQVERRAIVVNEYLETAAKDVYAIGDAIGGIMLAHKASYEGILAVENALTDAKKKTNYRVVPRCVFTDPEVGCVGLTEKDAKAQEIEYKTAEFAFRGLGKAQASGKYDGQVKLIFSPKDDKILGAAIVGAHATDMVHELAFAIEYEMTVAQIGDTIHAHPTMAEAIMEAAHNAHDKGVHSV